MITISSAGRCRICARPLTLHQRYTGGVCGDWRCRERVLRDELLAHRQAAGQALGIEGVEDYPVAVVPWRPQELIPIDAGQRGDLERFLLDLLEDAHPVESQPLPGGEDSGAQAREGAIRADGGLDRLLGSVCAVCRGFCCFYGGTRHAFLDADTLAAFRRCNPEMDDAAVAKAYLDLLPERHCAGSCAYHTAAGCNLPRSMRANLCNTYECPGLKAARRSYGTGGPIRACIVVRHDHRIVGSAFVDPDGIASYPRGDG